MTQDDSKNVTIKVNFPFQDLPTYQKLITELRFENRYFLSNDPAKFVEVLVKYGQKFKTHKFSKNMEVYRSRINSFDIRNKNFTIDEMGAPPPNKATYGRINPVGIPYLYLSSDIDTAVAEVRPWIGCELTVAKFQLSRNIEIINFSEKYFSTKNVIEKYKGLESFWKQFISYMFSMPFDPRDDTGYIPIQYISEKIKSLGYAGILYDSSVNASGYNLCLFNVKDASGVKLFKVKVNSMAYENKIKNM